jgi:hypothetical protein
VPGGEDGLFLGGGEAGGLGVGGLCPGKCVAGCLFQGAQGEAGGQRGLGASGEEAGVLRQGEPEGQGAGAYAARQQKKGQSRWAWKR